MDSIPLWSQENDGSNYSNIINKVLGDLNVNSVRNLCRNGHAYTTGILTTNTLIQVLSREI